MTTHFKPIANARAVAHTHPIDNAIRVEAWRSIDQVRPIENPAVLPRVTGDDYIASSKPLRISSATGVM